MKRFNAVEVTPICASIACGKLGNFKVMDLSDRTILSMDPYCEEHAIEVAAEMDADANMVLESIKKAFE